MVKNNVTVQSSLMPFSNIFSTANVKDCKNVDDVVKTSVPYNFKDCNLIVTKNGEAVLQEDWEKTKVKEGDLIGLNFIPQGGGGGKNTALQIVVMIAVVAATIYTGGAAAAAFAAGNIGTGLAWSAATVAVTMAGAMAQQALMSVPKQSKSSSLSDSQTMFIEGARNQIAKYGIVPINLGTNRMFPNQAALPFTETSNGNQYCRQLFTFGYGKVLILDEKIGETNINDFQEIEMEYRLNADLNQGVKLYANDVYQENLSINLLKSDGYVVRTTQRDCDECEIDVTFQGLVKYNDEGKKKDTTVQIEFQYAPTGTQDWTPGFANLIVDETQTFTRDLSNTTYYVAHQVSASYSYETLGRTRTVFQKYQKNTYILLNVDTGSVIFKESESRFGFVSSVSVPSNCVVLGYVRGSDLTFVDNRSNLVGKYIENSTDFAVSTDATSPQSFVISVAPGTVLGAEGVLTVTNNVTSAFVKSKRLIFPSRGQYDVRFRRLTDDSNNDKLINKSYITALKSITYTNPVRFADISGAAMRVKATDQLNGTIDSYNVLVSTLMKSYNPNEGAWIDDTVTSNPADIFRYVLQSPAFAKRLTDDKIDLEKLEEWWEYCYREGLTYNKVIDSETSVDDVLNDICAAGFATLSKVNNIYSVIIDNERPIVKGMVTPRNSWDYKGSINYPDIPHALRIEFRNNEKGYETDERIVYADGYDETNAELYERLQFSSCTNSGLAYLYGRRYFATALLQPETHEFKMDFEYMTFNRGDRITLINDVILVGVGQARIRTLIVDDVDNPTQITGFTIDDKVIIPQSINLAVRIRDNNATQGYKYHLLQSTQGETNIFSFVTPIVYSEAPAIGSLCAFVEDGKELDLIITGIKAGKDQTATITAIDYAPGRFTPIDEIPEFNSQITIPEDFYKPYAPELMSDIQSDESVMIRNSDGSLTSVAIINLVNHNENSVIPYIRVKERNLTEWMTPTTLKKENDQIVVTGLQDGMYYDFDIRYQRQTGLQLLSDSLLLENIKFIGSSTPPEKVENFHVTVTNGLGLFEWLPSDDIDISHYIIRYSSDVQNVTWENSQIVMDNIISTSITNVIHKGTYLIKAVDLSGNESLQATAIISNDSGAYNNVVLELSEDPDWDGVKDNTIEESGVLSLDDGSLKEGYYYFDENDIDLSEVYECSLSANVHSILEKRNRVRDIDYIRDLDIGIRDYGSNIDSNSDWLVELQMNTSNDGITWTGWESFRATQIKFRYIKFRLYLYSDNIYTTPRVDVCKVVIDMPDRYESETNLEITNANTGAVVTYSNAFWNDPAVNVTVQDGAVDDRIEFVTKNNQGFTIKIFNATLNTYVTRTFDYIAAGYGRVVQ